MTPGRRPAAAPPEGAAPEAKRPQAAAAAAEALHANAQRRKPGETDEQLRQRLDRNKYKRLMAQAKRSTAAEAAASTAALGTGSRAGPSPLRPLAPSGPELCLFGLLSPPSLPADAIPPPLLCVGCATASTVWRSAGLWRLTAATSRLRATAATGRV